MHPAPYPSTPRPRPPALHLLHGLWIASCPTCGFQLATSRTQQRALAVGWVMAAPLWRR